MSSGRLYLVPTPIGNLEDITLRAIRVLKEVDWIACEDTRQTAKLLNHYEIKKKCASFYKPKEDVQAIRILDALKDGQRIALVSDAGSPALSDPGEQLVMRALNMGLEIEALPGATALIPALTTSGFPTQPFVFLGFPPRKSILLKELLAPLMSFQGTLVFYESPKRLSAFCRALSGLIGNQPATAIKEISKIHEARHNGGLIELSAQLASQELRGEWVLIVSKTVLLKQEQLILETIDDIYTHFQEHHGLNKNRVRKIIQTRKNR